MATKQRTPASEAHKWEFKARFRRHAFGWKSQPAIARIKRQHPNLRGFFKVTTNY